MKLRRATFAAFRPMVILAGFLVLGLVLASAHSVHADALKPMSESEMSQVSGQAQATTIERLANLVDRQEVLRKIGPLREHLPAEKVSTNQRMITNQFFEQRSPRTLGEIPLHLIGTQILQPDVLMDPGAQNVLTHEAFRETMEIAGTMAKMFGDS